ncbi:putative uncharacterized protein DDB_G0282499 [Contarinia nasturtii]|uniref:putative uncharacterized protein DDB_G0282499 n=1 Tax=Contarinia nasturtii TaxID=265458 RepID=UPI0012D3D076|nr:putative uncharacterized protein DDB_G0282499 [Contarinia nasturtii]
MKWILLVLVISFECINCDQSDLKNGQHTSSNAGMDDYRGPRTFSFDSKEDDSGIHLHFWNDMNNNENYYPNLMKYITAEAVNKDLVKPPPMHQSTDDTDSIHINLNEILPQPQSQQSPKNQLKNAFAQTLGLDEFRKSDQNLYETYYKLNADRYKQSPFSWNYHPSAINYIPKVYDTNLNNAAPLQMQKIPSLGGIQRSTLYDQIYGTKHFIHDYYTNLHKKPKSVIDAVGYEIGGLPKYSGRLLANEPMPTQYRTFKMFEPVPRQIMLPPPTTRIPDFKPVPPRLKVIPVIDEYLETRPNSQQIPNSLPWTVIKPNEKLKPLHTNYLYPTPPQIIPFKFSEAITKAPIRTFAPKTEFNYIEPSTESYYKLQDLFNRGSANEYIHSSSTTSPPSNAYLPIHRDQKHTNTNSVQSQIAFEPMNEPISNNGYRNDSKSQVFTNEPYTHEYMTNINHINNNNNNIGTESLKFISTEDSRSPLNKKKTVQQLNDNSFEPTKRKKVKTSRKPQRAHEKITNDVIKLNVTGFRNVSQDDNRFGKNSESFDKNLFKKESDAYNVDKLKLHAIDSVSADSIQLSQTYSRQTTNVPHSKPTSASREQDSILMQLANDVKKALLTSLGNDTNNNFYESDEMKQKDPFLIAVYDRNERTKFDDESRLGDDLQLAETMDRSNSLMRNATNDGNSSIQRIDHGWATSTDHDDQNTHQNVNKQDERNHDDNHQNNSNIKTVQKPSHTINDVAKNVKNHTSIEETQNNELNSTFINNNYYKWFNNYAEKNKKLGRTVISEHFKKVEIEPNISFVLPRNQENLSTKTKQEKVYRSRRSGENETDPTVTPIKCSTTCTQSLPQINDPIS